MWYHQHVTDVDQTWHSKILFLLYRKNTHLCFDLLVESSLLEIDTSLDTAGPASTPLAFALFTAFNDAIECTTKNDSHSYKQVINISSCHFFPHNRGVLT